MTLSGAGKDLARCESWIFLEVRHVCKACKKALQPALCRQLLPNWCEVSYWQWAGIWQQIQVQGSRPVGLAKEHFDSALSASLSGAGKCLAQTTYRPWGCRQVLKVPQTYYQPRHWALFQNLSASLSGAGKCLAQTTYRPWGCRQVLKVPQTYYQPRHWALFQNLLRGTKSKSCGYHSDPGQGTVFLYQIKYNSLKIFSDWNINVYECLLW